jgi:hypothetical protein
MCPRFSNIHDFTQFPFLNRRTNGKEKKNRFCLESETSPLSVSRLDDTHNSHQLRTILQLWEFLQDMTKGMERFPLFPCGFELISNYLWFHCIGSAILPQKVNEEIAEIVLNSITNCDELWVVTFNGFSGSRGFFPVFLSRWLLQNFNCKVAHE